MKKMLKAAWLLFVTTLMDSLNLFSDAQAITATANSTNVIDQGDGFHDESERTVAIYITETFATLTSLTFSLFSDSAETMATQTLVFQTAAIPVADLVAGAMFEIPIPVQADRYLRMTYTVGGVNATAGKVTSGIVHDSGNQTAFRDGNL